MPGPPERTTPRLLLRAERAGRGRPVRDPGQPRGVPYAEDGLGYYAVYFLGPDRLKFECVHMPGLERAFAERGLLGSQQRP